MDANSAMDPRAAERRFATLLDEAGLPRFTTATHQASCDYLVFTWDHGFSLHMDLTREISPIDQWERAAILDEGPICECENPISVYVPGSPEDPRDATSPPGVEIVRGPPLHPDDVTTIHGLPVTTPSRTLIDLAEVMTADELRAAFARAREIGLLDPDALRASRARVEWRPSLAMLDRVIEEFCG